MVSRVQPFAGDYEGIARDLGKVWAWCEYIQPDMRSFTLVAGAIDLGTGRIGIVAGLAEIDRYFDCGEIGPAVSAALVELGYLPAPVNWFSQHPFCFVRARPLSAHEALQAVAWFRGRGVVEVLDI